MDQVHEGGCGCGAVRFRVEGQPIYVNNCHCRLCQRQTGSTGVVNAFYESDRLTVLGGDLAESTFTSGSGGEHVVSRCAACGTALFSYYPRVGRAGVGIR
ncbi:MAG TPA: GFA family protein, partial [Croceibacterium sp.]|nr:GFA family protein [Croceibacterium sp.]